MNDLAQAVRAALQTLNLDVPAEALDRAAVVAAVEIEVWATLPVQARVIGVEWATVKARADEQAATVGAIGRGVVVLVGVEERGWRPLYGFPLGWVKGNLLQEV